jgi:hypothetical protein
MDHAHALVADALVRGTLALGDPRLRVAYVADAARTWSVERFAGALDVVCARAEQAEVAAREALIAVVDALNGEGMDEIVQRLREQAAGESLLALERLVRPSPRSTPPGSASRPPRAPDFVPGRELTLGERKWLARRPDRETMQRLLADPHPEVIRRCLGNPRITEDDVVRLAAKRPGRREVLVEIARSRWAHSPRVRVALVLNPATSEEIAVRIAGLLLRPELELVARSPGASALLRAVCLEHLERRPPVKEPEESGDPPPARVH